MCSLSKLHKLCLPNSITSKLPNYILKMFYANAINGNNFSVFIHERNGLINGCLLLSKKEHLKQNTSSFRR